MDYREIPREEVNSSNVAQVGYDKEKEVLVVKFHSGGLYAYIGVPENVPKLLREAPSIGKFMRTDIIPNFEAEKLN